MKHNILLQDPPDSDETYVPHILEADNAALLENLIHEFSDVIVPDGTKILMGQSNLKEFDLEFLPGGEEALNNSHLKAFPAKGIKREMIQKAFQDLENLGGGKNNDIEVSICFASPCFLASRPRSPNLRLCLAMNLLNAYTVTEVPSIPNMEEIINLLKDCIYISIIDLRYAYNQVRLARKAIRYLGILHATGIFAVKVMSFSYKNACTHTSN